MKRDENSDKNLYGIVWIQKDFGMEYVNTEVLQSNTSGSRICVKMWMRKQQSWI